MCNRKKKKTSVSCCSKPALKTHHGATVRAWCIQFHAHDKTHGMCVHNHFTFHKHPNDPKEFACGNDIVIVQKHNIALLLESRPCTWLSLIHTALKGAFTVGTDKHRTVQHQHRHGCRALFDLICPNHPEHDLHPTSQIKDRHSQKD